MWVGGWMWVGGSTHVSTAVPISMGTAALLRTIRIRYPGGRTAIAVRVLYAHSSATGLLGGR